MTSRRTWRPGRNCWPCSGPSSSILHHQVSCRRPFADTWTTYGGTLGGTRRSKMDAPNKATVPASVGPCPNCGTQLPAGKRLWLQALLVLLVSAYLPKVVFGLEILAFAILIWRYHYFVCARCDTHVRLARRVGWSTTSVPGGCPSCSQPTEDCTRTERFGTAAMFAAGLFLLSLGALLSLGSFMVEGFQARTPRCSVLVCRRRHRHLFVRLRPQGCNSPTVPLLRNPCCPLQSVTVRSSRAVSPIALA